MQIYDQHLHTFLSHDSTESFENYLEIAQKKGISHFVSTEHIDFATCSTGENQFYDQAKQDKIIRTFQKKYPIKLLKGVEIGYKFSYLSQIEELADKGDYDIVILSVHEEDEQDCRNFADLSRVDGELAFGTFLDLYLSAVTHCSSFDALGHIDFLLRYIGKISIEKYEGKLIQIFEILIKKKKALEFNTRFLYQLNDSSYLVYLFQLYYKLGGRKITIGSDAHACHAYLGGFDEARKILKDIGFTHCSLFQKHKEILASL